MCDRGLKPARGTDANQIQPVLVHFSHFCTASPLPHHAQPADKQTDTKTQFLSEVIFKLKRQVSSTTVIFTCMRETEDYDQNKHQNLCSAYCCLTQSNSNTVTYLDTDRKIISNYYRAAGIIVSSCLASPIKKMHEGTGKILF